MTIEFHQPKLEALIQQRIDSGSLHSVEEVLMQAMKELPVSDAAAPPLVRQNMADFQLASPPAGSGLVTERA